jgi:hypothetical protein
MKDTRNLKRQLKEAKKNMQQSGIGTEKLEYWTNRAIWLEKRIALRNINKIKNEKQHRKAVGHR